MVPTTKEFAGTRSSLPVLLLLGGVAWTAGQAIRPDTGMQWAARLDAVADARGAQSLSAGILVVAGILLVAAAVAAARVPAWARCPARPCRQRPPGHRRHLAGRTGCVQPADVSADRPRGGRRPRRHRPGFVPLLLALPALLLGPVLLAVGVRRAGSAGHLPWPAAACRVVGIGTFMATEFRVKAGEVVGLAVASVGQVLPRGGARTGRRPDGERRPREASEVPAGQA